MNTQCYLTAAPARGNHFWSGDQFASGDESAEVEIARASGEQFIGCWSVEGGSEADQHCTLQRLETALLEWSDAEVAEHVQRLVEGRSIGGCVWANAASTSAASSDDQNGNRENTSACC